MAAPSSFAAALRRCISRNPSSSTGAPPGGFFLVERSLRTISSGSSRIGDPEGVQNSVAQPEESLRDRIFRLRLPKRSATAVLERWINEKGNVTAGELRRITRDLRRAQRFKHALEILTWMESRCSFSITPLDYAQKLELIAEAHGLVEAEAYYAIILRSNAPLDATSVSLLYYYVKKRCLKQAETLFMEIKKMGISTHQAFNDMMKLYMAIGQPKKILSIIHEMRHDMIPMDVVSYNIWMKASCEMDSNIASVERVFKEMVTDRNIVVGWSTYSTLASIYTRNGQQSKAFAALKDAEDRLSAKNRLGYFFLITLYASLNDPKSVKRLWESSKKVPGRITSTNYMCIILSLVKLGDIKEAEKAFFRWELDCRKYDIRVPNVLLGAYVRMGWIERAESLHLHTLAKGGKPNYKTWEILMEGWIAKGQMDRAIYAMKKGLSFIKLCHWRPSDEVRMKIMMHLEGVGDADVAWRYVRALQRHSLMNLSLYKSYLKTCIIARRAATSDVYKMAQVDGIELDDEALTLFRRVEEIRVDQK